MQILWVAKGYTLPKAGVMSHDHPYYHMFYVYSGGIHFVVDGISHDLTAGQTLLVPKQTPHSFTNQKDETAGYLEIKFTLTQPVFENTLLSDDPLVGQLFQQILKEYSDLRGLADQAAAAYLAAIVQLLTQSERYGKKQQFRFIDASSYNKLSQTIIRYLEDHFGEDITLDGLAELLGYNKSYLCVAFKRDTHSTIMDFLNMIRIRRAAELIVYSDHSLSQVAEICGFTTVSHFNRVFVKYVGITPGQCRRAYPANVLFAPKNVNYSKDRPGRFMYSVLAQKYITPSMVRGLDTKD